MVPTLEAIYSTSTLKNELKRSKKIRVLQRIRFHVVLKRICRDIA
ncbi:hypothetical protein T11_495 [Trichinella zimbabwensis]|uniref:Uncharacterized protein n=1 Tax=Trichinella zimbabwensis TaxID=268475 RepID=A0A0V1GC43_9BILA|nr:hypothetical protein T11_495 [Trichinella zimbabwensis]